MNTRRVAILIGKELREFRANPAAVIPVAIVVAVCVAIPFVLLVLVPSLTGAPLSSDRTLRPVVQNAMERLPALAGLPIENAMQAFLFQQFLLLFQIAPILGAVSLAAYSVVGEKQGRTLEPLLTTPLTTAELLLGKVLASFLPSLFVEAAGLTIYAALIGVWGLPGVAAALASGRTLVLVALIGPFATLAALQLTIAVSSRVNDPRSAQQIAALLVLPLVVLLIGQITGGFFIPTWALVAAAAALAVVWGVLILFSVALFERETILTRWK